MHFGKPGCPSDELDPVVAMALLGADVADREVAGGAWRALPPPLSLFIAFNVEWT